MSSTKRPFTLPKPAVKLANLANADSEILPGDRAGEALYAPDEDEAALIALVESRFKDSADARRPHEGMWLESLAFWRGDQWSRWNSTSVKMESLKLPNESDRVYAVANKLRPKAKKIIARAFQAKVDIVCRPLTDLETDREASREADAVMTHLDAVCERKRQTSRIITGAVTVGPHFTKVYFDKMKTVPVPRMDEAGAVTGVDEAQIGEICECVCSPFEIYPDPKAERVADGNWLIHAKVTPLSEIQARFVQLGHYVASESPDSGPAGRVENLLNNLTNDLNKTSTQSGAKLAILKEMWEKPSESYPQGRYVFVASGVLLWADVYPYDELAKAGRFPIAELAYENGIETPFGESAISCAVDLQRQRNRAVSKIQEQLKQGDGKILCPRGAEISPTAFKSGKRNEIVMYTVDPEIGGHMPQLFPTPPLDPAVIECIKQTDADIDELMGVNLASRGVVPAGVRAEGAILALQDSDLTDSVVFQQNLEVYRADLAQIEMAIARQVYQEPRLLSVSDVSAQDAAGLLPTSLVGPGLTGAGAAPNAGQAPAPNAGQVPAIENRGDLSSPNGAGAAPNGLPGTAAPAAPNDLPGQGATPAPAAPDQPLAMPVAPTAPAAPVAPVAPAGLPAHTTSMAFKYLSDGRVVLSASSASPKSPGARVSQLLDMADKGMFLPQNIPTTLAVLRVMDLEETDKLTTDLISALSLGLAIEKQRADALPAPPAPPDPAALAQAQLQGKLQLMQAEAGVRAQEAQANATATMNEKMAIAEQAHKHRMEEIALQGDVDAAVAKEQQGADASDPTFTNPDPVDAQIDKELQSAIGGDGAGGDAGAGGDEGAGTATPDAGAASTGEPDAGAASTGAPIASAPNAGAASTGAPIASTEAPIAGAIENRGDLSRPNAGTTSTGTVTP